MFAKHPQRVLDDAFSLVEAGANQAATGANDLPHPTEAQAIAGNYRMGTVRLFDLPAIRIENVRGSYREGTTQDGTQWRTRLAAHYGYFAGTRGADGDAIDVFVGPFPESESAWVINQRHVGGKSGFDEHKCMVGFHTKDQAQDAYMHSFDRGWTGLASIVPVTINQLKWWLKFGNHKQPITAETLPFDGENTMLDKVLWDSNAQPVTSPLHRVMYDLRVNDADAGLMLDACTMEDYMADPDIEAVPVYDALVVEVASMQRKMTLLQKTMEAAGVTVKPTEMTIADPVKSRGVLQVMVLFSMSDGQTVSIWFHNPDTTPAKLTPMDELISWKWLINKKDVTIVVAPERGTDLNVREVSRRVMRLVEKNSEAFQKANAKAGERAAVTEALKTEIAGLEGTLAGLQRQIEVAKVSKVDATAAVSRQIMDLQGKQDAVFKQLEAEKAFGAGADTVKLEDLMNRYDDLADQILALRGEDATGRTSWETWQALRSAEEARKVPDIDPTTPDGYQKVWGGGGNQALKEKYQDTLDPLLTGRMMAVRSALQDLGWSDGSPGTGSPNMMRNGATLVTNIEHVGAGRNVVGIIYCVTGNIKSTAEGNELRDDLSVTPDELAAELDANVALPEEDQSSTPIATVDAAYKFDNATDAFKEWVADSVQDVDYSPFVSARAIDQKAKELGASVAWDVSFAVLDGVATKEGDDEEGEDFDPQAEFDAAPELDEEDKEVEAKLDGDFPGHPFRGNQYKKAGRASGAAVNASIRAKSTERRGDAKSAAKAHETAHHAHKAAGVEATGKAKKYHKVMAAFHGAKAGVKLDSVEVLDGIEADAVALDATHDDTPVFDWMLDDAGEFPGTVIGVITFNGETAGRAHIGGDGKAMVFTGAEGNTRVEYAPGKTAMWSDDDAGEMVVWLLKPKVAEPATGDTDFSRLLEAEALVSKDAILSDDPNAIAKLDAKLTALRMRQEFMKKANKFFKKSDEAGLLAMGFTKFQIMKMQRGDYAGRIGFPDYMLTNNNGVIAATRKRLDALIAAKQKESTVPSNEDRDPRDVASDPEGLAIVDPDAAMVPADTNTGETEVEPVVVDPAASDQADVIDPIKAVDTAYLETFTNGTADMFAADILERLEPMFAKYENDAPMMDLLNRAAEAYSDAAVKAAQAALAG